MGRMHSWKWNFWVKGRMYLSFTRCFRIAIPTDWCLHTCQFYVKTPLSLSHMLFYHTFYYCQTANQKWYLSEVLFGISLTMNETERFFLCLRCMFISLLCYLNF